MTLKVGMQHWVLKYYQICSNDDPGLTLTYSAFLLFLVPYAFVWEKGKTMDFQTLLQSVISVLIDAVNQYIKLYEYQRSRSFIDLGPNLSDLIFLNLFSSITT